jgi:murein DD-endopeptidase MepM/ murein hydrolase activator NlpD
MGGDGVKQRLSDKLNARLETILPEKRLFLKSDDGTRFVRLRPATQAGVLAGGALLVGWTSVVTAFFLIDTISASSSREQAATAQIAYESRLGALASERDARARDAEEALARFYTALGEVSKMQEKLLAAEQRTRELETGIEVVQRSLRRTVAERDAARAEAEEALASLGEAPEAVARAERLHADAAIMSAALADLLDATARERDTAREFAEGADGEIDRMAAQAEAMEERNDRIFRRLEEAVEVSLEPLDKVFERSGISTDAILEQVRRGYTDQGGPLEPLISTRGAPGGIPDEDTARANRLLDRLEEVELYRRAAESLPLSHPVPGPHRRTSGFGPRWGRMHSGLDFAGPRGSDIEATAEGTVTHAGWMSGYGKLVKIQHPLGFETRYAHLNSIEVKVGQRVSRGERIGGMGTTGRSTGVHLHYEFRRGGKALDPVTFLDAGADVF